MSAGDAGDGPPSDARPGDPDGGQNGMTVLGQTAIDLTVDNTPVTGLQDLTVGPAGNIYLTGSFSAATFNGENLTSAGMTDAYVASVDSDLQHRWLRPFGDKNTSLGVRLFWRDALYLLGTFQGTIDDPQAMATSQGGDDHLLLAMDSDGQVTNWRAFGSTGDDDFGRGLFVDSTRHVYLGGSCTDAFSYGGPTLTGDGSRDPCLAHLDQDMEHVYSARLLGPGTDTVRGIALFPDGSVLIVGYFQQTLTIESTLHTSAGGADLFVMRVKPDGVVEWSVTLGGNRDEIPEHVLVDDDGNMYIAISTLSDSLDLNGETIVLDTADGGNDALIIAADGWGNLHWSQLLTGPGVQLIEDIALRSDGTIGFVGGYEGAAQLGGSPLTPSRGDSDGLVGVIDRWGNIQWVRTAGSAGFDSFMAVADHPDGDLVVGGVVSGSIDLGAGPVASDGSNQLVVARLGTP